MVGYLQYQERIHEVEKMWIIIAAVIGSLLAIVLIVAVLLYLKNKKKSKKMRNIQQHVKELEMDIVDIVRQGMIGMKFLKHCLLLFIVGRLKFKLSTLNKKFGSVLFSGQSENRVHTHQGKSQRFLFFFFFFPPKSVELSWNSVMFLGKMKFCKNVRKMSGNFTSQLYEARIFGRSVSFLLNS